MRSPQRSRQVHAIAALVTLSFLGGLFAADPPSNTLPKPGKPASKAPPTIKPPATLPGLSKTPVAPEIDAAPLTVADWPKLIAEMKAIQARLAEWDKQFLAEKDEKKKEAISAKAKPE